MRRVGAVQQRQRFTATRAVAVVALFVVPASPIHAQDEPLWDQLNERLKSDAVSFGVLFQFVGDVQADRTFPGENGFSVANFRFSVEGRLDRGVDYLLQSNFGDLLDARIGFRLHEHLTLDAGRFKAPFSREFLTGAGGIDFVNRSQSVTTLVPGRALGVGVRGPVTGSIEYALGLFNGGGGSGGNARGRYLASARASWREDDVEIAVNGAWNGDRRPSQAATVGFAQLRGLLGIDGRMSRGPWLFAAELDLGLDPIATGSDDPWGGYLTLGYHVQPNSQVLLRLDHLDTGPASDAGTLFVAGWNLWPTSATELQVNGILPLEGFGGEPQLLVNVQLSY